MLLEKHKIIIMQNKFGQKKLENTNITSHRKKKLKDMQLKLHR